MSNIVKTLPLSKFATSRTEVKRHIISGGVVHLTDNGEHVMSITPAEVSADYEVEQAQEVADFEAFKAARQAERDARGETDAG